MAATKKPKRPQPSKNVERLWRVYLEQLEETGVELPVMENLRPFMGKRGHVLKEKIRSKKAQAAYHAAEQAVKQSFGNRAGSAAMGRAMQAQENKQRREIAVETHRQRTMKERAEKQKEEERKQEREKEKEKKPKKKPDQETPPEKPKSMKEKAQDALKAAEEKAAQAQMELEQARRDLHFAELIEEFQKGSHEKLSNKIIYEIYKYLESQGVEPEDIDAYIEKLIATMNDIPDEARALWSDDEFAQVLIQVSEFRDAEREDFSAALNAVVQSEKEDVEDVIEAIRYWSNPENNQRGMSFAQFWEEAQGYNEPFNASNWEEILEDES